MPPRPTQSTHSFQMPPMPKQRLASKGELMKQHRDSCRIKQQQIVAEIRCREAILTRWRIGEMRKHLPLILLQGQQLIELKQTVDYGQWTKYCEEHLPFSARMASSYMRYALWHEDHTDATDEQKWHRWQCIQYNRNDPRKSTSEVPPGSIPALTKRLGQKRCVEEDATYSNTVLEHLIALPSKVIRRKDKHQLQVLHIKLTVYLEFREFASSYGDERLADFCEERMASIKEQLDSYLDQLLQRQPE